MLSMFLSLYTMSMFHLSGTRPTGRSDTFANAADDHVGVLVEPIGIEPMTS